MKRLQTLISAGAVAAVTAFPVFAQQTTAQYTTSRMGNETAMDIAQRVGACGGSGIAGASFDSDSLVRVRCGAGGLEGGLGTGAAIGGAIAAVALIGLASGGDDDSTTSTPSTPGT